MTITDRNDAAATTPPKNEMSPKTRTAIAAVALLACLLVGAGIIYWMLFASSPKRKTVKVDPQEQASAVGRPMIRMQPQRRDLPGVTKADDEWVVRSVSGEMRVGEKAAGAAAATFRFPNGLKLPPEQVSLLAGRFRILNDDAMAAEWKVTPQQIEKLRALQIGGSGMNPSPAQREELWKLWTQYNGAAAGQAKTDAQKKLIEKLEEVAKAQFEPTRQQYGKKLDEIKTILTPEQVQVITRR